MKRWLMAIGMVWVGTAVWADIQPGSQMVSAQIGGAGFNHSVPFDNGDNKVSNKHAGSGGFQYLYFLSGAPAVGVGADIDWIDVHDSHASSLAPNSDTHGAVHIAAYQAMTKLIYPRGHWRPYVLGGAGIARSSLQSYLSPDVRQTFDSAKYGFAGTVGVGLAWFPREHFFLGIEARDLFTSRRLHEPTDFGIAKGVAPIRDPAIVSSILLSVGYRFGKS